MKQNLCIILIISLFIREGKFQVCPPGTVKADGSQTLASGEAKTVCSHVVKGYYADPNFQPGGDPFECPNGPSANAPLRFDVANGGVKVVCALLCPDGSIKAKDNNQWVDDPLECQFCPSGYYSQGGQAFQRGRKTNGWCKQCPGGKLSTASNDPVDGMSATLDKICEKNCPQGAVNDLVTPTNKWSNNPSECANCPSGYYFALASDQWIAGDIVKGMCSQCPKGAKSGAAAKVAGGSAKIGDVCDLSCPKGTGTAAGATSFASLKSECTHCLADQYYQGTAAFSAGDSECTTCETKKTSGAQANPGKDATKDTQCQGASTTNPSTTNPSTTNPSTTNPTGSVPKYQALYAFSLLSAIYLYLF